MERYEHMRETAHRPQMQRDEHQDNDDQDDAFAEFDGRERRRRTPDPILMVLDSLTPLPQLTFSP